ncbi:hypothetical protein SAMN04487891_102455 [Flagellimonas taeanensis]|nr:hypothetical protein SAMN04487891_102455 [Allomuricauda taeanensis]
MDFLYFKNFVEGLDMDIEANFLSAPEPPGLPVYELNGEKVSVYFRNEIRQHNVPFILNEKQEFPVLVAARYITPTAKDMLRAERINYMDSFGNAYFNLPGLRVYLERHNATPYVKPSSKVFTQAGGQLIYHFLQNPDLVNETQRYLAHISMISLGSVSKVMQGLSEHGYIFHEGENKRYQLLGYKELLDRWVPLVNEKILPSFLLGTYSFSGDLQSDWKNQFLRPQVFWSGEPAAALLTHDFFPQKFSMFTTFREKRDILQTLKLVPDPNGNVTLYAPFWMDTNNMEALFNRMNYKNVVHPVLIYAELVYSGEPRNLEMAQNILNEYLEPQF